LPSVDELARQNYGRYWPNDPSCMSQRQRSERRWAMLQQRREDEQARRQAARTRLPLPITNDEQLAAAKYQLAHLLWQGGDAPAAHKWLETILAKFPDTQTADRARQTLAKL
jgi:hypothetical protein